MTTTTNTTTNRYEHGWELYWKETLGLTDTSPETARSIWEADWADAANQDLPHLKEWMNPDLPLIDFGCGNGRQTRFLADHFSRIIATDVSESAIALAKRKFASKGISYRVLDGFDIAAVTRLHTELGDANVYMRTVLHQVALVDRERFVQGLKVLLGQRGTLYLYELGTAADPYIAHFVEKYGMPDKLQRILKTGMSPGPVGRTDLETLFAPEFAVVADGNHKAGAFTFPLGPNGAPIEFAPPTYFAIVKAR